MITPAVIDVASVPALPSLPAKKLKPQMSVADAQKAMKAAGMVKISARKIKGCTELGDYLEQIGVLSYGRACLAATTEHLRMALDECDKLKTKKSEDPDYRLSLVNAKEHLTERLIDAASALIKSVAVDTSNGFTPPSQNRSFLPGQAVFPVSATQVNVTVGGNSPPTDEKI